MPVRDLLFRPGKLAAELSRLEQRCGELRAACTAATTHWGAAGGGAGHDARERCLAALADLGREKAALEGRLKEAEAAVDIFLVRFRAQYGLRSYALLRWRCRLGKTWPEVCRELEAVYGKRVSLRSAQYWYAQALAQAEEFEQNFGPLG